VGPLWGEVKGRDLVGAAFGGKVVAGRGLVEDPALHIPLPVHRLVSEARCVLHTHMPYATALSMLDDVDLDMAGQSAIGFYGEIAWYEDNGLALDPEEGERMGQELAAQSGLMLRKNGGLVIGSSPAQAFERLYFLERACQVQILALSTGRALRIVPQAVVEATMAQFKSCTEVGGVSRSELHFDALKRLLDRSEADYAR